MYKIFYHPLVWEEDFSRLAKVAIQRIIHDIVKKLSHNPELYGKPLRFELKGYFKLRIGEYRVIYRIDKKIVQVFVVKVGFRRNMEAYIQATKRLHKK